MGKSSGEAAGKSVLDQCFLQLVCSHVRLLFKGGDLPLNRHATGGSIPGVVPRLSDAELNVTQSINNTGNVCISYFHVSLVSF